LAREYAIGQIKFPAAQLHNLINAYVEARALDTTPSTDKLRLAPQIGANGMTFHLLDDV